MKKCPKCGKENDDDAIFCDVCDWKLNMSYGKGGDAKYLINSRMFALGSIVLGVISLLCSLLSVYVVGIVFGGIGMFLGGYTQSFVRVVGVKDDKRKKIIYIALTGLILSVIGFMLGFANAFDI